MILDLTSGRWIKLERFDEGSLELSAQAELAISSSLVAFSQANLAVLLASRSRKTPWLLADGPR